MKLSAWDRLTLSLAPRWTLKRAQARSAAGTLLRHYEAAQPGRRTAGWKRNRGDANTALAVAVPELRMHARDLVCNNGWAERGQAIIANHTVGTGIAPKALGTEAAKASALWKAWAEATSCETEGRHTFYGLQHLSMGTIATDGEFLVRRRLRLPADKVPLNLQIQVLEADFLDIGKSQPRGQAGGPIVQGVEFDAIGRRAAYWLFPEHPGSARSASESKRVPAEDIIHVYRARRPGQARGVSWFGAAIVPLKELDEYEDATLVRQKIAACFAAFVTDAEGAGAPNLGEQSQGDPLVESFEPGMITALPPGKSVAFANPPTVTESGFDTRTLRKIAAALGVTYEDLTGDYSQVNFSSARMGRLVHWANVRTWQWHMLVPLLCQGVWRWVMEAAVHAGELQAAPAAEWTCPPMPMIEPDKEGLAYMRLVRAGAMTPSEMVREQGLDPQTHWAEYAADMKALDAAGIILDSDARKVSQAGLTQERQGGGSGKAPAKAEE